MPACDRFEARKRTRSVYFYSFFSIGVALKNVLTNEDATNFKRKKQNNEGNNMRTKLHFITAIFPGRSVVLNAQQQHKKKRLRKSQVSNYFEIIINLQNAEQKKCRAASMTIMVNIH